MRTHERNAITKRELHDALDALERNKCWANVVRVLNAWRAYRARFKVPKATEEKT
jgi:hypothetical protein